MPSPFTSPTATRTPPVNVSPYGVTENRTEPSGLSRLALVAVPAVVPLAINRGLLTDGGATGGTIVPGGETGGGINGGGDIGGGNTGGCVTMTVNVLLDESPSPSVAETVTVANPEAFASGISVRVLLLPPPPSARPCGGSNPTAGEDAWTMMPFAGVSASLTWNEIVVG